MRTLRHKPAKFHTDELCLAYDKNTYEFQLLRVLFARKVVNTWNSLPDSDVLSKSVAGFRHKVNKMHFSDYCGL